MKNLVILILIIAGIYWCYTNIDFSSIGQNTLENLKNEKTINAVTSGRQQNANDVDNALGR